MSRVIAVLFAAGKGSRLAPLTDTTPKPLLVVTNKPLIQHNMYKVADFVDEFVIVINHLAEQFPATLGDSYLGKKITYAHQKNPKGGTLDAFRSGVEAISYDENTHFLAMNSDDIFGDSIFEQFIDHIKQDPTHSLIGAHKIEDRELLKTLGVICCDKNGMYEQCVEKPQEYVSDLANVGLYYFPHNSLAYIPTRPELHNKEEYINEHFMNLYAKDYPMKVMSFDDMWLPVNTVKQYEKAKQILA